MIPSTVFPKYLLAKLYSENGQHKKAKQIAETILNSEVKVESSATREIMNEMKKRRILYTLLFFVLLIAILHYCDLLLFEKQHCRRNRRNCGLYKEYFANLRQLCAGDTRANYP